MRYLNTLYVQHHQAKVRHRRGSLLLSSPDGSQRVPLEAVDGLILLGSGQITTQALEACVRRGVRVAALKKGGSVRFVVGPATGGNVHLRTALYETVSSKPRSLELSKAVVAAKVQTCRKVIDRWSRDEKDLEIAQQLKARARELGYRIARVTEAQTPNHVRGVEGDAARLYFGGLKRALARSAFQYSERTRRPPRDAVNALLSFCYGLLVTEFIGALEAVGLDYQMGFFHRPRSGRPSLALDLCEELRPVTDRFAVSLLRRRQLGSHSFESTPGGAVYLSDQGKGDLIPLWERHKDSELYHNLLGRSVGRWALPSIQATLLARYLRGDLPTYPPYVMA